MGIVDEILAAGRRLLADDSVTGAITRTARSKGGRADSSRIDPIFEERSFSEPPGRQPPEAGFSVDQTVSPQESDVPTELIEEGVGLVRSIGDGNRQPTNVQANADVVRAPEDYTDDAPIMDVEYVDESQGISGNVLFQRDGTAQSYQTLVDARGLDTDNPSVREFDQVDVE